MTFATILAGATCGIAFLLHLASVAAAGWRWRKRTTSSAFDDEGVSIIRPVCGIENFARETLGSSFALTHKQTQILFCVAHESDPVAPLVRDLIAAHPTVDASLLVGETRLGANPKLNNVVKGWSAARHPWVAMADSNVLLPPDYVAQLFGAWRADCGLVSSPPLATAPDSLWAELECAFLNTHQARWQTFADTIGFGFAQGKTLFWRKAMLDDTGGVARLNDELAEDAAATKHARSLSLRVRLLDRPVRQPIGRRRASEVWARQIRWARLRRETFPLLFLPELLVGGLWPTIACAAFASGADLPVPGVAALFATAWYGAEILLALTANAFINWRAPLLLVLRDLLLPALWVGAMLGDDLVWRGASLRDSEALRIT